MTTTETAPRTTEEVTADAPAKVKHWLERAVEYGMTISEGEPFGSFRTWTIASPNRIDDTQLWLYYTPGRNGGSLKITRYLGYQGKNRKNARNATRREASWALTDMRDSLERAKAREAARAESAAIATADVRHGVAVADPSPEIPVGQLTSARLAATVDNAEAERAAARRAAGVCQHCDHAVVAGRETCDRHTAPQHRPAETVEPCGCPTQIIRDEGHQEGCSVDPTRPGWFMVGQIIRDKVSRTTHQITAVELGRDGRVARIAVSTNGGYGGRWAWYGDHPDAVAGLMLLEGDHIGLADTDRRPWPNSMTSAKRALELVLVDQCLSGWARINPAGQDSLLVNLANGTDPIRHLVLLERYMPYPVVVSLLNPDRRDQWPVVVISPRKG